MTDEEYAEENICPTCRPRVMTAVAMLREMIAAENYAFERHEALTDLMTDCQTNTTLFDAIGKLEQRFVCETPAEEITTELLVTELLKIWPRENWEGNCSEEHSRNESETENAESQNKSKSQTSTHRKTSAATATARAARNGKSKTRRSA